MYMCHEIILIKPEKNINIQKLQKITIIVRCYDQRKNKNIGYHFILIYCM